MKIKTGEKARLSGWVRLWMVLTVLSWVAGAFDLALSTAPLQWPFPLSDAAPQSVRQLLWFLGPILLASAWVTVGWVWRGFRPPPNQANAPHMGTKEIVQRALSLVEKIGISGLLLAWMGLWIFFMVEMAPNPWWLDLLAMVSVASKFFILMEVWESKQALDEEG